MNTKISFRAVCGWGILAILFAASCRLSAQGSINELLRYLPNYPDSAILVLDEYVKEKGLEKDSIRAQYFTYKGLANYYKGNFFLSADLYERALETEWIRENEYARGNLLNNLGIVYDLTGRYDKAMEAYLASLEIEENAGNELGAAQSKINIGLIHNNLGQFDLARSILEEARAYFERTGNIEGQALVLHNLSMTSFSQKKYEEAETLLNKAIHSYRQLGDEYKTVNVMLDKVRLELKKGNLESANDVLTELEEAIDARNFQYLRTHLDLLRSELFIELGDYDKAVTVLGMVNDQNLMTTQERMELEILIASQTGGLDEIKASIDNLLEYRDSVASTNLGQVTAELHVQYGTERKVMQIQEQRERLQRRNLALGLAFAVILSLIWLTFSLVRSNRRLQQSYQALFEKEKESQRRFTRLTTPTKPAEEDTKSSSGMTSAPVQPPVQPETEVATQETDDHSALWEQILVVMQSKEPYLDPNLRLSDLAAMCSSNRTYISRAISANSDQNFSGFINRYRVERAKREMLANPGYSFQAIGESCGFRAGSSFFRVFKEKTGLTPSQYVEMARKEGN